MFAQNELFSYEMEAWFNTHVEQPLAETRKRIEAGAHDAIDHPKFFPAAMALVWLQGLRSAAVNNDEARRDFESLQHHPEAFLASLVESGSQRWDLQLVETTRHTDEAGNDSVIAPLYVPSSGAFPVVYTDTSCRTGHSIAIGVPLHFHYALVATPTGGASPVDSAELAQKLQAASVSRANAARVVLHPQMERSAHVAQVLNELRRANDISFTKVKELRELVMQCDAAHGLETRVDKSGRILR